MYSSYNVRQLNVLISPICTLTLSNHKNSSYASYKASQTCKTKCQRRQLTLNMLQNNNNASASISRGGELKILERDGINPGSNDSLRLAVCTESPDIFFIHPPTVVYTQGHTCKYMVW